MDSPLVGKTITLTYETGFPGASIEINFFSKNEKTSRNLDPDNSWVETVAYDATVIAPEIYFASWTGSDGHVVTAVFNLNDMTIISIFSNPEAERIPMSGFVSKVD